jgi:hypothetical protein
MNVQDLVTVSLDRVIGDRVPVEAVEAYAVLQFVWEQLRASRDGDGRMMPLPALDALAISATGDIDTMRRAGEVSRSMRPPHEVAQELGHLLGQLLSSGGPDQPVPAACLDAVRRVTLRVPIPGGLRPIAAPEALFTALEAFRPRDTFAARAALFARWVKTSHGATTRKGSPPRQPNSTHRTGGRPARQAEVELRLHFDATGEPAPAQAVQTLPPRPVRQDQTTSRGRLSIVVS